MGESFHPSLIYQLERFDLGVVWLDQGRRVIGMNDFARKTLAVKDGAVFDQQVLSFHPERSRPKVKWLLDSAECPVSSPPPMAMIINVPERVLMIKVCKIADSNGETVGFTLVFHDITDSVSQPQPLPKLNVRRLLRKIPTFKQNRITLVDVEQVIYIRSDGHYTHVQTAESDHFCNLSISDLEERLDPLSFVRIHRSYIVNLSFARHIVRDGARVVLHVQDAQNSELPVSRSNLPRLMASLGIEEAISDK